VDNSSPLREAAVCVDCPAPARERRGNRGPYPSRCAACSRKASTAAAVARSAHHAAAPERKACRSCHVVKPIADYGIDRSRRTGVAGLCRACDCTRSSARYYRNNSRTPIPAA